MKFVNLITMLTVLSCGGLKERRPEDVKRVGDSIHVVKLLEFNTMESATLLLKDDTLTIFQPNTFRDHKDFVISQFYFSDSTHQFQFDDIVKKTDRLPFVAKSSSDPGSILFDSIIGLIHSSARYSNIFRETPGIKQLVDSTSVITRFKKKLFIIGSEGAAELVIFDEVRMTTRSIELGKGYFYISFIFMNDLNNDGNPEIFIFHKEGRPHAISYDIFSVMIENK